MRAAYAAERVEIGPLGYDDWIYRRKAKAKPKVKMWLAEAERLLTLREEHRLAGICGFRRTPRRDAGGRDGLIRGPRDRRQRQAPGSGPAQDRLETA